MNILALILLILVAAACVSFLNQGPIDKEFKRRETYWDKYEKK